MSAPRIRIGGPLVHRNLAVFTLHGPRVDRGGFLTLDEALASGVVSVTEGANPSVQSLVIQNRSRTRVFLQEGERLQGGRQDRTVQSSVVIPRASGRRQLATFCIEASRWSGGTAFAAPGASALAPRGVRAAAKVASDQGRVWDQVARAKADALKRLHAPSASTSLNELFESPQVKKASSYFVEELSGALAGAKDVLGFAFAVNGRIEEVNLYASPALARKLYPRLLAGYALEAALRAEEAAASDDDRPASSADVRRFLSSRGALSRRSRTVDDRNELSILDFADRVACSTRFGRRVVHRQVLGKS